jgi:hypothetical protein
MRKDNKTKRGSDDTSPSLVPTFCFLSAVTALSANHFFPRRNTTVTATSESTNIHSNTLQQKNAISLPLCYQVPELILACVRRVSSSELFKSSGMSPSFPFRFLSRISTPCSNVYSLCVSISQTFVSRTFHPYSICLIRSYGLGIVDSRGPHLPSIAIPSNPMEFGR